MKTTHDHKGNRDAFSTQSLFSADEICGIDMLDNDDDFGDEIFMAPARGKTA